MAEQRLLGCEVAPNRREGAGYARSAEATPITKPSAAARATNNFFRFMPNAPSISSLLPSRSQHFGKATNGGDGLTKGGLSANERAEDPAGGEAAHRASRKRSTARQ